MNFWMQLLPQIAKVGKTEEIKKIQQDATARIQQIDPGRVPLEIFKVRLVGVTAENGQKLLLTILFIVAIYLIQRFLQWLTRIFLRKRSNIQVGFWSRQAIRLISSVIMILGLVSIWFDDPTRLTTAIGLVTAGLAFALQKVVTAIAGYFVILRGKTFNVGDRITMGGVRGDVLALGFIQTTIMEMGQPPPVQAAEPAVWVRSRQYTGRIVTVTNDKIFNEPVYNYTRDFPFLWEEIMLPITYTADRKRAERILLDVVTEKTVKTADMGEEALAEMERRYVVKRADMSPRVYYRITDNWLELTVRFIVKDHGVRETKDEISREILERLDEAKIGIASATYDIVGLPPLRIEAAPGTTITSAFANGSAD